MYDQVVTRARMRTQEHERYRASLRKPALRRQSHSWSRALRTALSWSVAFAAGRLAGGILFLGDLWYIAS